MEAVEQATLALWSVGGVGPKSLQLLERALGPLGQLLDAPMRRWLPHAPLQPGARRELGWYPSLRERCGEILEETAASSLEVCFPGDPAWPRALDGIPSGPPLLWRVGPGARAAPRRRVAMVGTRTPEQGFRRFVAQLVRELVEGQPVGVVSGLARGIDQWCHAAASEAGAETWAFLGSGLGALDGGLWGPAFALLDAGGTLFSEFPPRKRADKRTFPRRNRLISGASEVVLMLRGGLRSGALYTVAAARAQGRPVLAVPGDPSREDSEGCNLLLRNGHARACLSADDLREALALPRQPAHAPAQHVPPEALSKPARDALAALSQVACDLEAVQAHTGLDAATAAIALSELELLGLALLLPGRLYARL